MTKMTPKLQIKDITYTYDGEYEAVSHVSFEWNNGILCIKGPSGCGKTTLLKLISGILIPDEGSILVNGIDLKKIKVKKRKIAFIFQESCLYPHMTVYNNVFISSKDDEKVKYWLKKTGIDKYVNFLPKHLSQGMRQKVALAKMFASDSEIWILDEPFANLDESFKNEIIPIIKEESNNKCIIYVGHDDSIYTPTALWMEKGECTLGENKKTSPSLSDVFKQLDKKEDNDSN